MKHIAGKTPGWNKVRVCINGIPYQFCTEADDQEGYAICARTTTDAEGRTFLLIDTAGNVELETRHGLIEFQPNE